MKKKPESRYTLHCLIYQPDQILDALGIAIAAGDSAQIYSDGHNKVRIEIYKGDTRSS